MQEYLGLKDRVTTKDGTGIIVDVVGEVLDVTDYVVKLDSGGYKIFLREDLCKI